MVLGSSPSIELIGLREKEKKLGTKTLKINVGYSLSLVA